MKKLKKIIATVVLCTMAISTVGCKMIEKTPEAIQNTVLAKVGNEKITKGDIDKELKQYIDALKQQYGDDYESNEQIVTQLKETKKQYLNAMVNEKILLQQADALNLKPSDEEINKEVDEIINQYKTQYSEEGQYEQLLEANGFTEESFREYQKNQSIVRYVYNDIIKDVTVSDDEIQSYYNENKESQFSVGAGATVAHILVADKGADGAVDFDKSLETANALKAKIDAGADFAEVAKENSTDTGTAQNGGSLGFIPYNSTDYVTEFMDGFKDLKEGEVSNPIKSSYGYHIIKATGLKDAEVTPLEDVKEEIKSQLEQQKQGEVFNAKIEEWKNSLKVTIHEDKL